MAGLPGPLERLTVLDDADVAGHGAPSQKRAVRRGTVATGLGVVPQRVTVANSPTLFSSGSAPAAVKALVLATGGGTTATAARARTPVASTTRPAKAPALRPPAL